MFIVSDDLQKSDYSWLARDVTGSLKRTVRHVGVQAANLHMSKCTCDSMF